MSISLVLAVFSLRLFFMHDPASSTKGRLKCKCLQVYNRRSDTPENYGYIICILSYKNILLNMPAVFTVKKGFSTQILCFIGCDFILKCSNMSKRRKKTVQSLHVRVCWKKWCQWRHKGSKVIRFIWYSVHRRGGPRTSAKPNTAWIRSTFLICSRLAWETQFNTWDVVKTSDPHVLQ